MAFGCQVVLEGNLPAFVDFSHQQGLLLVDRDAVALAEDPADILIRVVEALIGFINFSVLSLHSRACMSTKITFLKELGCCLNKLADSLDKWRRFME